MYCLTNICYVCLKEKGKSLIDINSSLSVNEDIIHILGDLPFNLGWMKTKRVILICEECCRRLRETYQLLTMCLKNSEVLQGYMNKLNMSNSDNEAELRVVLNNKQDDISEIKLEPEEIYTVGATIEETEEVFVNVEDYFVKEEVNWAEEDDKEELLMKNNSTESSDNGSDWKMAVNSNTYDNWDEEDDKEELLVENNSIESSDNEFDWDMAGNSNDTHDTDTDTDSSEFTPTQVRTTNKKKLTTSANGSLKCLTCNISFTKRKQLRSHNRVHKGDKRYKCGTCAKYCRDKFDLLRHERTHTGEKPYECSICNKCFAVTACLTVHMRTHADVKPYICAVCKKCFKQGRSLETHMMMHTGDKRYKCPRCNKGFRNHSSPLRHIKKCSVCGEEFCSKVQLKSHMRGHSEQ